jgi:hypothetical protein
MLSFQLAGLYGVESRALVQAVKRNRERFPLDFMFQLTRQEFRNLRSQIVMSSWGGRRTAPYAFTEQGVSMLSSVLRSRRAVQINIMIMRAFVRIRQMVSLNRSLAKRLAFLERRLTGHDADVRRLYELIQTLTATREEFPTKHPIGF